MELEFRYARKVFIKLNNYGSQKKVFECGGDR